MLILSRVCAEFHDRAGQTLFTVRPGDLNSFLDAPETIRQDPLFDLLAADGSLEAVRSVEQKRQLEADPLAGITPEGKKASRGRAAKEASPAPEPSGTAEAASAVPASDSPAEKTAGEKEAVSRKASK